MKRKISKSLVLSAVIIGILFYSSINSFVQGRITDKLSNFLGVSVTIDNFTIIPFAGKASIKGLVIDNPDGFKTAELFKVSEIVVDLNLPSILSDVIEVEKVKIVAPEFTYERSDKASNVEVITKNAKSKKAGDVEKSDVKVVEEKKVGKGKRKFVVKDLYINDGKINLATEISSFAGKKEFNIPSMHLQDVGRKTDGATLIDIGKIILAELHKEVNIVGEVIAGTLGNMLKGTVKLPVEVLSTPVKIIEKILPLDKMEKVFSK